MQPIEKEDVYDELIEISTHVGCFPHTIQQIIKDGFNQAGTINKVLSKVSTIASHVHKSIHASEILESEKCHENATITCWNSQMNMVWSILIVPEEKLDCLDTHHLTVYDCKTLEDLIEISHTVHKGDKVVTSSMIVPCVRVLKILIFLNLTHQVTLLGLLSWL